MPRDRNLTEQQLITATGQVIAEHGFAKLGVNSIARAAGLDKVLIYRYFEGLPGLIQAYAKQGDFWPTIAELLDGIDAANSTQLASERFKQVMTNYAQALRKRPITLKILSWEMVERNELTAFLEEVREQQGLALTEQLIGMQQQHPTTDTAALAAIVSAAINYLTARSEHIRWFNGVDLHSDAGWQRLIDTIGHIADALMPAD